MRSPSRLHLCLILLLAILPVTCSESSSMETGRQAEGNTLPTPAVPVRRPRTPLALDGAVTPEARIAFYAKLLGWGDQEEVAWANVQLRRAGEPAIPALRRLIEKNLVKNPMLVENVLTVFVDGLPISLAREEILHAAKADSGRVRLLAASALGAAGSEAVAPLLDLVVDPLPMVAQAAISSLAELNEERAGRGLLGRFDQLRFGVRVLAIDVIADSLPAAEAVKVLRTFTSHDEIDLALAATRALLRMGDRSGLNRLLVIIHDLTLPLIWRNAALDILADARDPRIWPDLIRLMERPDKGARIYGLVLLGSFSGAKALPLIEKGIADADNDVRREALYAFYRVGAPGALDRISRLLGNPDRSQRLIAALLLGLIRSPESVPDIAAAGELEDDPGIRLKLASALVLIGVPNGAPAVARILLSETVAEPSMATTAHNAGLALMKFEAAAEGTVEILLEAVESDKASIRMNAARPLARFGSVGTVASGLEPLLTDESPNVRRSAARAWLDLTGSPVLPLARAYAQEPDNRLAKELKGIAERLIHRWRSK